MTKINREKKVSVSGEEVGKKRDDNLVLMKIRGSDNRD